MNDSHKADLESFCEGMAKRNRSFGKKVVIASMSVFVSAGPAMATAGFDNYKDSPPDTPPVHVLTNASVSDTATHTSSHVWIDPEQLGEPTDANEGQSYVLLNGELCKRRQPEARLELSAGFRGEGSGDT